MLAYFLASVEWYENLLADNKLLSSSSPRDLLQGVILCFIDIQQHKGLYKYNVKEMHLHFLLPQTNFLRGNYKYKKL